MLVDTEIELLVKQSQSELGSDYLVMPVHWEEYREYEWVDQLGCVRVYRIPSPAFVIVRKTSLVVPGATGNYHRVVDRNRICHCVPAPGYFGCVLRWHSPSNTLPVSW